MSTLFSRQVFVEKKMVDSLRRRKTETACWLIRSKKLEKDCWIFWWKNWCSMLTSVAKSFKP